MTNGLVPIPPPSPTQIPSPQFSAIPPGVPFDRHVRRGQEEYAHALAALLPQGIAWPRWPESTIMKVVYGLAGVMGWADGRAADLLEREADPRVTTEMLDSWERAWGLPDPCFKEPQSVEERRQLLVLKMTLLGAQSREFFIDVASWLGYPVTISEYRPFMVGIDACGDNRELRSDGTLGDWPCEIGHPNMRFYWTVHIQDTKAVWFRAGSGQAGIDPHLRIARAVDLECLFRRWGPAHTIPLFDYSGISDPFAGADRFNVTQIDGEEVTLRDGTPVLDTRPTTIYWPQAPDAYYLGSPQFATPQLLVALAPPDPQTSAWINAVTLKGGSVDLKHQQQIDLLIKGLKADGLWSVLDRIFPFASVDQPGALVDIVALASGTNVNACDFMPDNGFVTNFVPAAGTSYIDSHFNPASAPGRHYSRNLACIGVWVIQPGQNVPSNFVVGSPLTSYVGTFIDINDGGLGVTYVAINDNNPLAGDWSFAFNDTQPWGYYAVNRSGQTSSQAYRNGMQIQSSLNPSVAPVSSPFSFCSAQGSQSSFRLAIGFIAGSMTPTQHARLYTRLRNYLTGIGTSPGTPPLPPDRLQ